jgi:hypothetical protein
LYLEERSGVSSRIVATNLPEFTVSKSSITLYYFPCKSLEIQDASIAGKSNGKYSKGHILPDRHQQRRFRKGIRKVVLRLVSEKNTEI